MAGEPPFTAAAAAYGLVIRARRQVRHVWQLETDRGCYALKSAPPPAEAEILRLQEEHLTASGFTRLPRLVKTINGASAYVADDGRRYVLRPWLPGTRPHLDQDHPHDLSRTAKAVAEMHLASSGWRDAGHPPVPAFSAVSLAEMRGFAAMEGQGRFAALYRRALDEALREGETACRLAEEADYPGALRELAAGGGFCHGDLAAANMLVHGPEAYLLDFDRARVDASPADLGMLLRRVLPAGGWRPALAIAFIRGYEQYRPLSPRERRVLVAVLHWPQAFWRLGHQYFIQRLARAERFFADRLWHWRQESAERRICLDVIRERLW